MIFDFSNFIDYVNSIGLNLLILVFAFAPMSMRPLRREVYSSTVTVRTLWAGFSVVLVIMLPTSALDFLNGFQFDLRQPILTISAYFLGLYPSLIVLSLASFARLLMGVDGFLFGVWSIIGSVTVGLIARVYSEKLERWPVFSFLLMGLASSLIWLLSNQLLPVETAAYIYKHVAPYMVITNALLSAFFGMIVLSSFNSYQFSRTVRKNSIANESILNSLPDPIIEIEIYDKTIDSSKPIIASRSNAATKKAIHCSFDETRDIRVLFQEYTPILVDNIEASLEDKANTPEFEVVIRNSKNSYSTFSVKVVNFSTAHEPPYHIAISLHDVTDRHHLEQANFHLKYRDTVTSVGNRAALEEHFNEIKNKNGTEIAFITIHIIELFELNTSLGLKTTDDLIADIANRLTHICQSLSCEIGRLSGGSFGILLSKTPPAEISTLLDQIKHRLSNPYYIDDVELNPTIHVGYVSSDDLNFHEMIASAKLSIRKLPRHASEPVLVADMDALAYDAYLRNIELANELRHTLEKNLLSVHYQPIVKAASGEIVKAEALVRWFHPRLGFVSPGEFIPIAENLGLITRLGLSIREQVVQHLAKWKKLGIDIDVSINVSPLELASNGFSIRSLSKLLDSQGLDHSKIVFEITESTMVQRNSASDYWFSMVAKCGFNLAIDDFGTGYSSLSMLDEIDAQFLKIDKSLVDHIAVRKDRCEVLRHIVTIAHINSMEVVAEGIESKDQAVLLQEMNVDYIQGYYYYKPMSERDLTKILLKKNSQLNRSMEKSEKEGGTYE